MVSASPAAVVGPLHDGSLQALFGRQYDRRRTIVAVSAGAVVLSASLLYYAACIFPGLGGELGAGDSAKFQILGHTSIMVHGSGYPLVLLLAAGLRALHLPFPPWWTITFALSVVPAALCNTLAFAIVSRLTGHLSMGLAAALLLGSSGLMAIQATDANVYTLNLFFILATALLLIIYLDSRKLAHFVAACAVYALSFGNHLMMIFMLPVFGWIAVANHRQILRPGPIAIIGLTILVGASQYLYLAYVAYDPHTSYSEYMRLPPTPMSLVHYIMGTYFSDLFGAGLKSTRTLNELIGTLQSAQPWLSLPLIAAGGLVLPATWRRRDAAWRGIALLYATGLAFSVFAIWYGPLDIRDSHLPVLGPLLLGGVAALGWWAQDRPVLVIVVALVLTAVGLMRSDSTAVLLSRREPMFADLPKVVDQIVAQSPVEDPIVAMSYELRMATLYYQLEGKVAPAIYRLYWRAIAEIRDQNEVGGIVVPTDGFQFIHWIEHKRPDMDCASTRIVTPMDGRWPAYGFKCTSQRGAAQ